MAECSFARCQQERRAIRKELQRWTKNMVHILGLERVAEELMGRRKWKLYQDALVPRRNDADEQTSDDSMPASEGPPPGLKIKTIEQINAPERDGEIPRVETETNCEKRPETILESLIKRPSTHPKVEYPEEPSDWKPADKCYFCVDGEPGGASEGRTRAGGAISPASESDSSSVSGPKSPSASPQLLQHLLQLHTQNPQAVAAQFQQMMATLAALSSGLVPPAQALLMQRLMQNRYQQDRISTEIAEKVSVSSNSPSMNSEQPLDLSAKSNSSGTPPPENKYLDNSRLKRTILEGSPSCNSARRAYTEEGLQSALKDIQTGKLGTRRAAVVYGIPRSTLRNKVYKMASDMNHESDVESDPERDSPPSVILKIPTFPPPDEKSSSPATSVTTPVTPITPILAPQPSLNPPSQLLLPPSVFADPPSTQHLFTSLSDVIAKSISQKFQQPLDRPSPDMSFMRADRHVSVIKNPADGQRPFPSPGNSRNVNNNNGQPAPGGKGTRPKRGKYRNYDRDSLVEAVKAVQRGEMSVHRAGSYYGVPHSTLEYKVKERHLMRPRKREPKPPQDVKPQPPKPAPKPPTKPFSNGMNGPDTPYPPGYPFWAPGFAPPPHNELYASHMMRRLRDEVPPANGSFLEGIIRSSLANERPGAALLQRLAEPTRRPPDRVPDDGPPAARRPRLDGSDLRLAADMRDAVQRLRADKARRSPPPPGLTPPASAAPSAAPSPPPAPPDRA